MLKNIFSFSMCFLFLASAIYSQQGLLSNWEKTITIKLANETNLFRGDESVFLCLKKLKQSYPDFNEKHFVVYSEQDEIPSQAIDKDEDGSADAVVITKNIKPRESKEINIYYNTKGESAHNYKKRTQCVLYEKVNYNLVDGYYTGGEFQAVTKTKIPQNHFAHNALYKTEGPAWESDKVGFRFYLDSRNKNDIFGKKVDTMVLQSVGINDLVSDSKESYTKMSDWGMDIFKVGESLGLGSIAIRLDEKNNFVSKTDSVICSVEENGPLYSSIKTNYFGWEVDGKKYNLCSNLSITAGSRLSKVNLKITGEPGNICTGIPKHDNTEFVSSSNDSKEGWSYIALYGKQSLSGDDLGIVVFYNKLFLIEQAEDALNYYVTLKPDNGKLEYYFGAVWQSELNGIKSKDEFVGYLNDVVEKLNNPIKVGFEN
ncbi:MAG: DUF4861 domain-containing protein [bacterium]